jgi:hypothetical protein
LPAHGFASRPAQPADPFFPRLPAACSPDGTNTRYNRPPSPSISHISTPTTTQQSDGSSALLGLRATDHGPFGKRSCATGPPFIHPEITDLPRSPAPFQNRNSKRFSTISGSPSLAASESTNASLPSGDPRLADIRSFSDGLQRLENKPLTKQRFVPTDEKSDNLNKLALGAKVERALGRRMSGQDAVMRQPKTVLNEKATAAAS